MARRTPAVIVSLIVACAVAINSMPIVQARPISTPTPVGFASRPTVNPQVAAAQIQYAADLAAAERAYRDSARSAEFVYREALRIAGTKEAVQGAQASALASQANLIQQARDRLAAALARAATKAERASATKTFDREMKEIERATAEALRQAQRLLDAKTARDRAERARVRALSEAAATLAIARQSALSRLNAVLIANGLPPVTG